MGARLRCRACLDELADHAMTTAKVGPRRSEAWIQLEAALVQITRPGEPAKSAGQLVRAEEIELIGGGVQWCIGCGRRRFARQRERQRGHHASGDVIL